MNRRADRAQAVIKAGVRGEATILSAEQTGTYVNNQLLEHGPAVASFTNAGNQSDQGGAAFGGSGSKASRF